MIESSRNRFMTAVRLGQPDLVPVADGMVEPAIVEQVTGIKSFGFGAAAAPDVAAGGTGVDALEASLRNHLANVQCHKMLGLDAIQVFDYAMMLPRGFVPEFLDESTFVDSLGRVMKVDPQLKTTWWMGGVIREPRDFDSYRPPDPCAPGAQEVVEAVIRDAGGKMAVIGAAHPSAFTFAWQLRGGIDKLAIDLYERPEFAERLIATLADVCLEYALAMMDLGVDLIGDVDDFCDKHGPMVHPRLLRKFFFPYVERMAAEARRRGIPIYKHCCGNVNPILDDLIALGINVLNPIDPNAMDLAQTKEKYGGRICIMGNVDCAHILPYATEEETRQEVRRCIDQAAAGGGYVLSSSNSIHANVKVQNFLAMVDEARRYGRYAS